MLDPFPSTLWRKEWDRWYLNGAGDYAFTDNLGMKAQIFYDQFDNKITTYTDTSIEEIASDGNAVSTHDNSLFGYFINPYWDLGRWSYLRAGIRYQKDDVSIQDEIGDPWHDYAAETFSFSLEDEIRLLEPAPFRGGCRVQPVPAAQVRRLRRRPGRRHRHGRLPGRAPLHPMDLPRGPCLGRQEEHLPDHAPALRRVERRPRSERPERHAL